MFHPGHHEISVACAEQVLLPRLRAAAPEAVILADGFSCRTQIHELDSGGREAMHLAELLSAGGSLPADHPEQAVARPTAPSRAALTSAVGAALAIVAVAALAGARRLRC